MARAPRTPRRSCNGSRLVVGPQVMAFQRKKPAAIGIKVNFPGFIEPALATSIEKVPSGDRWLHEIKFDGYRVQVHLANMSGPSASGRSPTTHGTSAPDRRSSTAR